MENLPIYVSVLFSAITLLTLLILNRAVGKQVLFLPLALTWLVIQAFLSYSGFYLVTETIPPRFLLLIGPPLLLILYLFISRKGKMLLDTIDPETLTYLHCVRIPVEITLWLLFSYKFVPQLMTFEGRNFDILSGITAPLIAYFGYRQTKLNKKILLVWNFICLGLLINIVINAVLSVPFPFQQFAFDQPNTGVLYFPFTWLPCFIVPAVLFSHLVCIRKLLGA